MVDPKCVSYMLAIIFLISGVNNQTPINTAVVVGTNATLYYRSGNHDDIYFSWILNNDPVLVGTCSSESLIPPYNDGRYSVNGSSGWCNLTIVSATDEHAGRYYVGNNQNRQTNAEAGVIVLDPPPQCTTNATNGTSVGDNILLICSMSFNNGGRGLFPQFTWTPSYPSPLDAIQNNTFAYSRLIARASPVQAYKCNITFNNIANPPSYQSTCRPPILSDLLSCPTNIVITGASSDGTIDYGSSLTCQASSNPPATYNWFNAVTATGPSIVITSPGSYYCMATNFVRGSPCSATTTQTIINVIPSPSYQTTTKLPGIKSATSNAQASQGADVATTSSSADSANGCFSSIIAAIILGVFLLLSLTTIVIFIIIMKRTRQIKSGNQNKRNEPAYYPNAHDSIYEPEPRTTDAQSNAKRYKGLDSRTLTKNKDETAVDQEVYQELDSIPDE